MKKILILSFVLLFAGASMYAQDTTYVWTGGSSESGTIVLDSPSSSGGSLSDIVSIDITDPSFGVINGFNFSFFFGGSTFTWNSSQITQMEILSIDSFDHNISTVVAENEPVGGSGNEILVGEGFGPIFTVGLDNTGSWLAAPSVGVPDGGSSVWLLGLALAGLGSLKHSKFSTR
jgi:hypothetical protein